MVKREDVPYHAEYRGPERQHEEEQTPNQVDRGSECEDEREGGHGRDCSAYAVPRGILGAGSRGHEREGFCPSLYGSDVSNPGVEAEVCDDE